MPPLPWVAGFVQKVNRTLSREQVEMGSIVFGNLDRAIDVPIINPMRSNVKCSGNPILFAFVSITAPSYLTTRVGIEHPVNRFYPMKPCKFIERPQKR